MEGERNLLLSTVNHRNYIFLSFGDNQLVDEFKQKSI